MCAKAPSPPEPAAPPAPVPVRDNKIQATQARQTAARRSASSGYESTMATPAGGLSGAAPVTSPVLGG